MSTVGDIQAQCMADNCGNLGPEQHLSCITACAAMAKATAAKPKPAPSGGGGGGYVATAPPASAPSTAMMYKPPSKSNALLIGAAVGGLALIGLVVAKKKGWIK